MFIYGNWRSYSRSIPATHQDGKGFLACHTAANHNHRPPITVTLQMDNSLSRRHFLALLGGVACVQLLSGCLPKAQPISIATHNWPGYEPLSLARSLGWLDEKQVTLIETHSATESIELLKQGKIGGAGLTLDEVLRIREFGIPLVVVLVCDISAGADMLLVKPHIKTLGDLKGKRIAVEDGALGALMLFEVLLAAGIQRDDVRPISLTVDQHAAAWQRGEIDAAISFEPGSGQIKKLGGQVLFDSRQIPELIFDVIAVHPAMLGKSHEGALHHLIAAHLKALKHIHTNPEDAAYRMAPRLNLPPDEVMSSFKGLVLPDLDYNLRLLNTDTPVLLKSARTVADTLLKAGILQQPANLNDLLQHNFLHDVDA